MHDAELTKMKKEKNNLKVNEWEKRRWRTEVEKRKTLEIAYIGQRRKWEKRVYIQTTVAR